MDINEIHFQPNVRLVPLLSFPYWPTTQIRRWSAFHIAFAEELSCLSRFVHFNEILRPMYWASVVKEDFDRLKQFRMGLRDSRPNPTSPLDHGHHRRNWPPIFRHGGLWLFVVFSFSGLSLTKKLCAVFIFAI